MDQSPSPESGKMASKPAAKAHRKRATRKQAASSESTDKVSSSPVKRTRKPAPPKAAAPKSPSTTRRRKTSPADTEPGRLADFADMIATAAYYLAERRGFAPGHELEDWLTAEHQIRQLSASVAAQP